MSAALSGRVELGINWCLMQQAIIKLVRKKSQA
ncbi:hypothetical protein DFAR_1060001 [Desulfarculales bacterium]